MFVCLCVCVLVYLCVCVLVQLDAHRFKYDIIAKHQKHLYSGFGEYFASLFDTTLNKPDAHVVGLTQHIATHVCDVACILTCVCVCVNLCVSGGMGR